MADAQVGGPRLWPGSRCTDGLSSGRYTDFYRGDVRSLRLDNLDPDDSSTGLTVVGLSSFGEDAAGRVYVTDLIGNQVLRLVSTEVAGVSTIRRECSLARGTRRRAKTIGRGLT